MLSSSPPPRPVSRMGWHASPDSPDGAATPRLLSFTLDVKMRSASPLLAGYDSDSSSSSDDDDDEGLALALPRKRKRATRPGPSPSPSRRPRLDADAEAHDPTTPPSSHRAGPGAQAITASGRGAAGIGSDACNDVDDNNNNTAHTASAATEMPPSPRRPCRALPAIPELEEGELDLDLEIPGPSSPRPSSPSSPSPLPKPPMSPPPAPASPRRRYSHKQLAWRAATPERLSRECTPPKFRPQAPRLHLCGSPRTEKRVYGLLAAHLRSAGDTATLATLLRVSHAAYSAAAVELYRNIVLTASSTPALVNTLTWPLEGVGADAARRARLRRLVRSVTIASLPPTAPAAAAWIGVKGYPALPLCPAAETVAIAQPAWAALGESTLLASMVRGLASPTSLCVDVHAAHGHAAATPRLAALVLSTWLLPAWTRLSRVTVHSAQVVLAHASADSRRALFRPGVGYVLVFSQCGGCAPGVEKAGKQRKRIAATRADQLWGSMARALRVVSSEVGSASGVTVVLPHDAGRTLPLPAEWRARGGTPLATVAAEHVFPRAVPSNFAFLRVEDCAAVCDCCPR